MSVEDEFKKMLHAEIGSQALARNLVKEQQKAEREKQKDSERQRQKAAQYQAKFEEITLDEAEYWDSLATIHFFMKFHNLDLNPDVTNQKRNKAWQLHTNNVAQGKTRRIPSEDRQQLLSVVEWIKLDSAEVLRDLSDKPEREKRDYLLTLMNLKTDDGALLTKHYPKQLGGESKSVKSISDAALGIAAVAFVIFLVGGVLSGKVHWMGLVLVLLLLVAMVIYGRRRR